MAIKPLTVREQTAIQNVLDMWLKEEKRHAEEEMQDTFTHSDGYNLGSIDDIQDGEHIYFDLLILQNLLERGRP